MLGANDDSSAIFSSCSEAGAKQSYQGEVVKAENDQKKADANAKAVALAAKTKKINDVAAEMKGLIDCTRMTAQAQYTEACYTALVAF